jgi:protein disulfide-isomerase A6
VLLFTEKKDTPLLVKKLSLELHRAAVIGEAPASDKVLAGKFGVTSFPTLLVSPGGAQDPKAESFDWKRFDGDISYKSLKEFLATNVPAVTAKPLRDQAAFESECASKGGVW